MKKLIFLIIIAISIVVLPSCASNSRTTKVNVEQDGDANTRNELSGEWNDADLRDTAKTLTNQMLSEGWYKRALKKKSGELPDVKIGKLKNHTGSHNLGNLIHDSFKDSMKRVLINSGLVNFVMSKADAQAIREEQDNQMTHASDNSVKESGNEAGADYMVLGQFSSMEDRLGGKKVKYLQVNLRLIDIESGRVVWVGEKKIKKFIQQKSRTW